MLKSKNTVMNIKVLLLVTLFPVIGVSAQNKLTGQIINENQEFIPGVSVFLYIIEDSVAYITSTQTDETGKFLLENLQKGDYIVKISIVGMAVRKIPVSITPQNTDMGIIEMVIDNNILKEVIVKGKMPETTIVFPNMLLPELNDFIQLQGIKQGVLNRLDQSNQELYKYKGIP
jgi:hypothetical protein